MMERGDLCEVSQVAVDSPFGVVRLLLNLRKIQLENLRLIDNPGPMSCFAPRVITK